MKFIEKFKRFMQGRYGSDDLSQFLIRVYILLFIINIFFNNNILNYIELLIFVIIIFRLLSKNIYNRRKENNIFLNIKRKFIKPFKTIIRNIKDKEHIYKKCKHCKTLMKLPVDSKIGMKIAKCPKCHKTTKVIVLKKEKVEIISKNK